ncbi:hypothetical protein BDZ97DRAFT_1753238 [Flammula alnicola]|nr:hypothetical protein BDZ97DRAFT_1753238 [Flammula alnicola]
MIVPSSASTSSHDAHQTRTGFCTHGSPANPHLQARDPVPVAMGAGFGGVGAGFIISNQFGLREHRPREVPRGDTSTQLENSSRFEVFTPLRERVRRDFDLTKRWWRDRVVKSVQPWKFMILASLRRQHYVSAVERVTSNDETLDGYGDAISGVKHLFCHAVDPEDSFDSVSLPFFTQMSPFSPISCFSKFKESDIKFSLALHYFWMYQHAMKSIVASKGVHDESNMTL